MTGIFVFPALAVFWWVKARYGYGAEALWTMVLLCLVIAILQLLTTPVRRAVPL